MLSESQNIEYKESRTLFTLLRNVTASGGNGIVKELLMKRLNIIQEVTEVLANQVGDDFEEELYHWAVAKVNIKEAAKK